MQYLEVESLKTKDRVEVATKELKKVIHCLKDMLEVQENSIDLEHGVLNVDECDVENPITSKTKGQPRGSRGKGGVEASKKPRHCHYPNCGGTDHDSRNYPIKRKKDSLLASQSSPKKYQTQAHVCLQVLEASQVSQRLRNLPSEEVVNTVKEVVKKEWLRSTSDSTLCNSKMLIATLMSS
ncbi:hypothetical protein V8G54_022306 [Vigna mungo]|uniref:Uncharacterized protein n=1 Tax=Vigna mungo TaxID=3915 RepID=A0AAQ3NFV7_VIGMU